MPIFAFRNVVQPSLLQQSLKSCTLFLGHLALLLTHIHIDVTILREGGNISVTSSLAEFLPNGWEKRCCRAAWRPGLSLRCQSAVPECVYISDQNRIDHSPHTYYHRNILNAAEFISLFLGANQVQ